MRVNQRQEQILELLKKEKSISVNSFATRMNVSEVTIRKDLSLLESQNLLYRAYGCAIMITPSFINDRHINEKEHLNAEQKERIAMHAASMIEPNDSILIASGTTMHYLARHIEPKGRLTVITASIPVAEILSKHNSIELIMLGGVMRHSSQSVVGNYAETMVRQFSCSKLFIGVDGIDPTFGLSTTNIPEATLNYDMIRAAQKTIVLCDSSKFGLRGLSRIADTQDINQIVTDTAAPAHYVEEFRSMGVDMVLV